MGTHRTLGRLGGAALAAAIVVFLAVQGLRYLDPKLLATSPSASVDQSQSGGILDPIEDFWAEYTKPDPYEAGTSGPASADALMARDGRAWRRL